jgi:uncharacterized protein (TIGR03435 family)
MSRYGFCLAGLLAVGAAGQSFEVASVKALKSSLGPFHFKVLPNRIDAGNMNLQFLIKWAYEVRGDQLSGPSWLSDPHFDIAATTGEAVSQQVMRAMMQSLLAERFHLATHWETRTVATYRLAVLPKGPKMKVAEHGYPLLSSPTRDKGALRLFGPMSMGQLAEGLARFAGRPVVDGTNLDGYFEVALTFAAVDLSSGAADGEFAAPLLTTAVQEQLGLKLVPESGPVKILVVDHAEAVPTAN